MVKKVEFQIVPFFKTPESQIFFEFIYLIGLLFLAVFIIVSFHFDLFFVITHHSKVLIYAAVGGFLGGWTYDAKWFYRVTARGRKNQYKEIWEEHKFYWRILIPFVSGLVAFAFFCLISSDNIPISLKNKYTGTSSYGLCFLLGYFSDVVMSFFAKWLESKLLIKKQEEEKPRV
jgi:hypothetical protein